MYGIERCMVGCYVQGTVLFVNRRLEDRIRALCSESLKARKQGEVRYFLEQLQAALREHTRRLKRVASLKFVDKEDGFQERRTA
jgi:hypothetical protein